jgi:TRAP-type C4-dicarboxylate transport system permease small subunit
MLIHVPNHIPKEERRANLLFSALLFAYGSYGVWVNDLYIPGKRSRGIHLHDVPAWIMYAAMICACVVMLSVVIDHYDQRNNERHYRTFAEVGKFVGWGLFGASLFWALFRT